MTGRDVQAAADREQMLAAYLEKRDDLVRFLTARLGSKAAAEDLVQDLYVRLATSEWTGPVANPSAFLYRVAINLMLDRNRGDRRVGQRDQAWQDGQSVTIAGAAAVDAPSPEQAAAARQRLRQLMAAVETLPPKTRRAFELHKLEGLSQAEAAERLGVTRKTIENQLAAALRHLVERLGGRN
jgi:RNA polymerase sigma-70 factor (ECF subfamily)